MGALLGDQLIGTRIGNFLLTDVLGSGEQSVLFRGAHPEIGRQVAIKVLSAQLSGEVQAKTRFLDEARILARIQHENVIGVLDFGKTMRGELYYVMELLSGTTLDRVLTREGTMRPDVLWPYLEQICDGLGALHDAGVVHRDLRPQNIFIVESKRLTVKLIDIGIAKIGGPATAPATVSTDLYAVGALISLMLDKPLPARIGQLVHRCLAAAPEDRPASADEISRAYQAALEGREPPPVEARAPVEDPARVLPVAPPAPIPPAPAPPFERPKTTPGVGLVGEGPIKRQRSEQVTEWSVGGDDQEEPAPEQPAPEQPAPEPLAAEEPAPEPPLPAPAPARPRRPSVPVARVAEPAGPPSDLLSAFAGVTDPDSDSAPAPEPEPVPDLALQAAVEALADEPPVEAPETVEAAKTGETEPRSLEELQSDLMPGRRMAHWMRKAIAVGAVVGVVLAVLVAFLILRPGKKEPARPSDERRQTVELAVLPPATGLDAASAEVLRSAEASLAAGQPETAAAQLQRLAAGAPRSGRVHFRLGEARQVLGKLDEAVEEYRRAFALEARLAAPARNKVGEVFLLKQNSGQAFAEYRAAVAADDSYAPAHVSLGYTHAKLGSFADALQELDRAVALDPKNARALLYRGTVLSNLERKEEAVSSYRAAVALRPGLVEARYQLGLALAEAGQSEAAIEQLEAALHLDPDYAPAHIALGKIRPGR